MSGGECERCGEHFIDCGCDEELATVSPKSKDDWIKLQAEVMNMQLIYCKSSSSNIDSVYAIIQQQLDLIKKITAELNDEKV